jgi:hypothetical protein
MTLGDRMILLPRDPRHSIVGKLLRAQTATFFSNLETSASQWSPPMQKKLATALLFPWLMIACIDAGAQRRGGGRSPVSRLLTDLQQAIPRAKLTDEQNTKIQTDVSSITQAMQAKQQGQSVDQDQLKATVDDLHQIVDSGAFQDPDQKQLDQDFAAVQPQ